MTATNLESKLLSSLLPSASVPIASSIVIHAVFLSLIVPGLSQVPEEEQEQKLLSKVPVVELNAAEKTRLPDLSTSSNNVAPLDNQSGTQLLDPSFSSNLPNNSSNTLPPLPSLPQLPSYNSELPPQNPSLPPLPSNSQLQPLPSLPPLPSYNNELPPQNPSLPPLPNNINPIALNPSSLPYVTPSYPRSLPSLPPENLPPQTRPRFENPPPISNPDNLINNRLNQPRQPDNIVNDPNQQIEKISPEEWRERLIAQRIAEIRQKRASLQEDKTNTSDDEAMRNNVAWMSKVRSEKPVAVTLDGIYPKDACLRQLEGTSVVGIVVDASGRITSTIDIIKSAGYPILNQQAISQVQQAYFKNTIGSPQPHRVNVNFKYNPDSCKGYRVRQVPPPVAPEINPEATPITPEIKPEVTRQTKPEIKLEVIPITPEIKPEVTPTTPEIKPEVTRQTKPEIKPEVTPITPEVTREEPEATPEVKQPEPINSNETESTTEESAKKSIIEVEPAPESNQ